MSEWFFFSCSAAGVFVHCCSSVSLFPSLSHLLLLISMETGPGAFSHIHTLAINQQVRPGSIPTHTHHRRKQRPYTRSASNHRHMPERIPSHLASRQIRPGNQCVFVHQIWQPSDVSIAFGVKHRLKPHDGVSELTEICSYQLLVLLSLWDESATGIV